MSDGSIAKIFTNLGHDSLIGKARGCLVCEILVRIQFVLIGV